MPSKASNLKKTSISAQSAFKEYKSSSNLQKKIDKEKGRKQVLSCGEVKANRDCKRTGDKVSERKVAML